MDYRKQHAKACQKAFEEFELDVARSRQPDLIRTIARLARQGMFSHEIAEIVGKSPKAIQKIYRRFHFPSLHNIHPPRREQRQGWKGGRKTIKGYNYVRCVDHPNKSKHGGYVAQHRLVMEQCLGRYLTKIEVVDHIDGDTQNNAIENLRLFSSNGEHLKKTLVGRCPNWSDDGKKRIDKARHKKRRTWLGVPR